MQVTSNNLAPGDENKSLTLTSLNKSASSGKFSENSSVDPLYLTHSRNFAQDQDRVYYICLLFKCIHHMNTTRIYRKCDLVWELIQVLFQHWFPSIMLFFRNNQVTGFFLFQNYFNFFCYVETAVPLLASSSWLLLIKKYSGRNSTNEVYTSFKEKNIALF